MKASRTFKYGEHDVTIETGVIARQADGAVVVKMGDTVVLVTAVGQDKGSDRDFFPLTVNYQEKTYAAGRIPGGFFKREGRPSEKETLTSRLIDRPIRPLFPEGFLHEVQVIATVLSMNPEIDPDVPSMIGASAALALSGLPFQGPIGGARVGYVDGEYLLNPTFSQLANSDLDLFVAGTESAVLMVESSAKLLSEDAMLGAVMFGHEQMQAAITAIKSLAEEAGKPPIEWQAPARDETLAQTVRNAAESDLAEAYSIAEKQSRYARVAEIKQGLLGALADGDDAQWVPSAVEKEFKRLEKGLVRGRVLSGEARIDGRDARTVRPISGRRAAAHARFTRDAGARRDDARHGPRCTNHRRARG